MADVKLKFKAGALVQLKAGGPKMVVESWNAYNGYLCTWFSGAKHNSHHFTEEALQPFQEKDE